MRYQSPSWAFGIEFFCATFDKMNVSAAVETRLKSHCAMTTITRLKSHSQCNYIRTQKHTLSSMTQTQR